MKRIASRKSFFWALLFLPALAIVGCDSSATLREEFIRPNIDTLTRKLFHDYSQSIPEQMEQKNIPGLSIAVVDRQGILWTAGFGQTGKWNQPVTPDTLFSIQSMSKTFTATAVMMAVQDGLVDLDEPINRYLSDFTVHSCFEENPQEKITLRHLLSHTSGLPHEAPVGNNFDVRCQSFGQHIQSIRDTWLKFPVGQRYDYSNLGIDLAAYILQVKSGMPFEMYMKTKIFDPLGMIDSSVDYETIKRSANRALGHTPYIRETPVKIPMLGAAGVFTSARELSRFVQFHLNHGQLEGHRLLEDNLIGEMYTSFPVSEEYALGIEIIRKHQSYCFQHGGGGIGFGSNMIWYPEYGVGCIVLTNVFPRELPYTMPDEILDTLITKGMVTKLSDPKIPPADHYIGKSTKLPAVQKKSVHTPTPYHPEWKHYIGTYRFILTEYKPDILFSIAMAAGYCHPYLKVMVYEKDGFLWVGTEKEGYRSTGHEPLEQILPGLFIAPSGETLDFRGSDPTWKNIRMKKIRSHI